MNQGNMWYRLGPLYTTSGVGGRGWASLFLDKRYRISVLWDIKRKENVMIKMVANITCMVLLMILTSLFMMTGQFWFMIGSFSILSLYIVRMYYFG